MGHPLILQLDVGGEPARWINYERAVFYYSKELVAWSYGDQGYTIYGGKNRHTGNRSSMDIPSIIAVKGKSNGKAPYRVPALTNRALFRRDHSVCAYCTSIYGHQDLTRDHIIPTSKGGKDVWTNVVTACGKCNRHKDDRTPEQAGMTLHYVPYAPTKAEYLILMNRTILADQMQFLLDRVSPNSRLLDDKFKSAFLLPGDIATQ
jgi:5-methylcytosine-specific restriction endonuclease McrA